MAFYFTRADTHHVFLSSFSVTFPNNKITIFLDHRVFPFPACLLSCWQWQWQTMAMVNTGDQALQTQAHLGLLLQHQNIIISTNIYVFYISILTLNVA